MSEIPISFLVSHIGKRNGDLLHTLKDERHTGPDGLNRASCARILLTLANPRSKVMPLISSGLTLPRRDNGRSVKTTLLSTCSSPYLASNRSTRRTVKALGPSEA